MLAALEASQKKRTLKRSRTDNSMTVTQLFGAENQVAADLAVAEFVVGCGLPFNLLLSDYFKRMLVAVHGAGKGYKPPSSERMRTKLLKKTKERCIEAVQPYYDEHKITGCTLAGPT